MEKRLNKKSETYITTFKDNIRDKAHQLGLSKNDQLNHLLQYVYDYETDKWLPGAEDTEGFKQWSITFDNGLEGDNDLSYSEYLDNFGSVGNTVWDNNYIYIKTNNGWKRTNLENF